MVEQTDLDFLYEGHVNDCCQTFTDTFVDLAKQCIPNKTVLIGPNEKPWSDSELRKLVRKKIK